jgi:D-alanyl-D-alanine carboxypeptidase
MQLIAEERLDLDQPVRALVPAAPPGVTVRQLLDHTAGVPDYSRVEHFTDRLITDRERVWTTDELLALVGGYSHDEPGTRYSYSNTGYLLLGEVVAAVTGRSWAQEVRARILDPLRLSQTWVAGAEAPRGAVLPGYGDGDRDGDEENLETGGPWPSLETSEDAAGAMVSTARDVARFGAALFRGRLLPAALLTPDGQPRSPLACAPNAGYGLGVEVASPDNRTVSGATGLPPGFRSALALPSG